MNLTLFLQDTRGIPSDRLNRVLRTVQSTRHERERKIPNIQQIREHLKHQVSCKIEERTLLSTGEPVTDCLLVSADGSQREPPFHSFNWFTNFGIHWQPSH